MATGDRRQAARLAAALCAVGALGVLAACGSSSQTTQGGDARSSRTTTLAPTPSSTVPRTSATTTTSTAVPPAPGPDAKSVPPAAAPGTDGGRGTSPSGGELSRRLSALPVGWLDETLPYDRTAFGPAWSDVDRNGCDTRNDILRRDLTAIETRPGTHDCVVVAGLLADPYTATTITFVKARADEVQIDHLIPLHAAWQLGAWRWSAEQRKAYANDPRVLLAVSGRQNASKGDRLADRWRPPNHGFWCEYASRTITIHELYALPVTAAEKVALGGMAATCTGGAAASPAPPMATVPVPPPPPPRPPPPPPPPTPAPTPPPSTSTYYANCSAARAAGAAPLHRGDPGYRDALDRDQDGIACE